MSYTHLLQDPDFRLFVKGVAKMIVDESQHKQHYPEQLSLNQAYAFCKTKQRILKALQNKHLILINHEGVPLFLKQHLINWMEYGHYNPDSLRSGNTTAMHRLTNLKTKTA